MGTGVISGVIAKILTVEAVRSADLPTVQDFPGFSWNSASCPGVPVLLLHVLHFSCPDGMNFVLSEICDKASTASSSSQAAPKRRKRISRWQEEWKKYNMKWRKKGAPCFL